MSQSTFDATWYDTAMTEPDAPSMLPLEVSPWLPVYREAARLVAPHEEVVDLGCGTGRFVKLLYERGHYARVTGVDWSRAALAESARYAVAPRSVAVSDTESLEPPAAVWELCDLADWRPDPLRAGNTVYVCVEVLEHLDDDRELVRRVPPGHRLVFSVPNYDSASHLRVFRSASEVWRRYDRLLDFRGWSLVGEPRKAVHVCETVRRDTSW